MGFVQRTATGLIYGYFMRYLVIHDFYQGTFNIVPNRGCNLPPQGNCDAGDIGIKLAMHVFNGL